MVLQDVLEKELKIVFCGTAVGNVSAERSCYYAGSGNQFWPMLKKFDLIPENFQPEEFRKLPSYGLGLTDLVKARSATDADLRSEDFDIVGFRTKIESFTPKVLAFNGKRAAEVFLGRPVKYGLQEEKIGNTLIFVLPSTSRRASEWWDESQWREVARFVTEL